MSYFLHFVIFFLNRHFKTFALVSYQYSIYLVFMHSQSITVCISDKHTPQHRHQGGKTIKYLEETGSPGRRLMVCVNQALFLSRWVCLCPQAAGLSPRGAGRQARMLLRCAQREEAFYRLQGYVHSVEHDR